MRRAIRFYDHVVGIMAGVAAALLVFITLIVSGEVAYRWLSGRSLGWVEEITSYCLLIIAFLAAPWVLKLNGHVRMDLVFNALGPKVRRALATATSIVTALISLTLFFYATRVSWDFQQLNYFNPTVLAPPKFVFIAVIAFGFLLLTFESIRMASHYSAEPVVVFGAETVLGGGVEGSDEQTIVRGKAGLGNEG